MNLESFIVFLLIGLIAGWLTGKILRGKGFGLIANLVIGVIGSFLGGVVFRFVGFHAGGWLAEIVVAVVGSILLVFVLGLVKRR
ncbi:MAG: GlsB/YeaQ/YmgE family stress response membrane protein [Leptospira sp.]|nr:GlsB/YeaQ/YmgE family stress response membrane protein [Leptospira sp.]